MIISAIILFTVAVALGLFMVVLGVRYHRGSLALGLGHAGVAGLALALLVVRIFRGPTVLLYNDAALLFALTLVGGLVLLGLREGRKPPPMVVVGIHGAIGVVALSLMLVGYTHV